MLANQRQTYLCLRVIVCSLSVAVCSYSNAQYSSDEKSLSSGSLGAAGNPTIESASNPAVAPLTPDRVQAATRATEAESKKPSGSKKADELEKAMKEAYKPLFYNNNFSYLSDPAFKGPYFLGDSLKQMADGKIDVGGEIRSRYHNENNFRGFGLSDHDDQFWLTRLRTFGNYRITDNFRFYGEYLYADSAGETFLPRATEENRGDAQNLFVDATLLDNGDYKLSGRVGRQELLYGAQRLIGPLDWANTRRTFDGYMTRISNDQSFLDFFFVNPLNRVAAVADTNHWDSADHNQQLYGAYFSTKKFDVGVTELYYIGYDNQNLLADFSTNTIGGNINGGDEVLYDIEGGTQFGHAFNGSEIGAGFFVLGLGRKLEAFGDCKPTLWGYWDWASGATQAPYAPGDAGFNQLLPTVHRYYGYMDLFARRNMNDFNWIFTAPLGKKVDLLLWYHYFLLDRLTTPYNSNNTPFSEQIAASKDIGSEIDMLVTFKLNPRSNVVIGYSYFDAGDYYKLTPGLLARDNAQFFYSQFTRFF